MGSGNRYPIAIQVPVIHEHLLDVVAPDFGTDHAKGLAEWIKNASDAYDNEHPAVPDAQHHIILDFEIRQPKRESIFRCIDFCGMKKDRITTGFMSWGNPDASRAAGRSGARTLGGHGNGGKFYMRQMFDDSYFVTYRDRRLTVFGFDQATRQYGYAQALNHARRPPDRALHEARLDPSWFPDPIRGRFQAGDVRFTVVVGERPKLFQGRATVEALCDRLRNHPQVRRVLARKPVWVRVNDSKLERLRPVPVDPKRGFADDTVLPLPPTLELSDEPFDLTLGGRVPPGELRLRTSDARLAEEQNAIDILGDVGCVATYKMGDLGWRGQPASTEFIFGECQCPALELLDLVRNDREKLVSGSPLVAGLLAWIRDRIEELAARITKSEAELRNDRNLEQSAEYNLFLNSWSQQFVLARLNPSVPAGGENPGDAQGNGPGSLSPDGEVAVGASGPGEFGPNGDPGGAGDETGTSGEGLGPKGPQGNGIRDPQAPDGDGGGRGSDEPTQGSGVDDRDIGHGDPAKLDGPGAGDKRRSGKRPPQVRMSGRDSDPFRPLTNEPFYLSPRHPEVWQRAEDFAAAIYWINTARPLAQRIMDKYGPDSVQMRGYLFQRHVDVILKDAIYRLEGDLTPERIDGEVDRVRQMVMDSAAENLLEFLLSEQFASR